MYSIAPAVAGQESDQWQSIRGAVGKINQLAKKENRKGRWVSKDNYGHMRPNVYVRVGM